MKMKKLFLLTLCLGSSLTLSTSCQKESNITKVCMLKTVDSMNLYLTAVAKGNVSSTYTYLHDKYKENDDGTKSPNLDAYVTEIYSKASNKARANCDVAYFPLTTNDEEQALTKLFAKEKENNSDIFRIVYVDSYSVDGNLKNITGVWVGRKDWINNKNGTGRKFVDGLAKAANYRASAMNDKKGKPTDKKNSDYVMFHENFNGKKFDKFEQMYTFMAENQKSLPEYIFADDKNESRINYKSVYEYCAIFALQNTEAGRPFNDSKKLDYFKKCSLRNNNGNPFVNNDKSKALYGYYHDVKKEDGSKVEEFVEPTDQTGTKLIDDLKSRIQITDDQIELKLMRHGIGHVDDKSSKNGISKVILWSAIGGGLFVIVITLLIVRRVKTGKKLFDIKKALDSDIDPEDPRIIRMKKVGKDLKALREKKKIPLNIAAKEMHIPSVYIKDVIEEGEVVLNKRLRKKYIAYYKLPADYFDKAYKLDK